MIEFALKKTIFFDKFRNQLSERRLKAIKRMLEEGPKGFDGGINAKKHVSFNSVAKAMATCTLRRKQRQKYPLGAEPVNLFYLIK